MDPVGRPLGIKDYCPFGAFESLEPFKRQPIANQPHANIPFATPMRRGLPPVTTCSLFGVNVVSIGFAARKQAFELVPIDLDNHEPADDGSNSKVQDHAAGAGVEIGVHGKGINDGG